VQRFTGHDGWVLCTAFLPGDRLALTAAHDKTLRVWKLLR
jgi:WD40 repeat protein